MSYAHLRDPRTRDLCAAADAVLYEAPLLALLRARQAYERQKLERAFDQGWHRVIHGQKGLLDRSTEFQAALDALRALHRRLGGPSVAWSPPKAPSRLEGGVDDLVARYATLEDRVNRVGPASAESHVGLADIDDAMKTLRKARTVLLKQGLPDEQELLLRLCEARVDRAIANHRGEPLPHDEERAALVQRGLTASNAAQWAALDLANMRCIARTNGFDFEGAVDELDGLRERFVVEALRDERLGRLLGSLGQAYGFLAHEAADPDYAELADECFAAALPHFQQPDDLLRQQVYRVHAAVEGHRQGGAWRERLEARLTELEPYLDAFRRGEAEGRSDYALAAWLKGRVHLGQEVPEAAALAQTWKACIEQDAATVRHEGMSHGMVVASGWLWRASPQPPRWLRQLLQESGNAPGLIPWIARAFLAPEDANPRGALGEGLPDAARAWWERLEGEERSGGTMAWVPFNFA